MLDMGFVAREIASPNFPVADAAAPVQSTAGVIAHANIAAIPVVDSDRRFKGLLSQRDIMFLLAQGQDLETTMTGDVVHGSAAFDADRVIERSDQAMIDGLPMAPVVEDGRLLGVVTPADVDAQLRITAILGVRASELITEVSPEDEMDFGLRGHYLMCGADALVCIRDALRQSGLGKPQTILDLPSGHGRVMRFLRVEFPDAELTACDVNWGGVDFCAKTFNARPVYSDRDLTEVDLDQTFDLVWSGALFMHLDLQHWLELHSFLVERVAPGGLLVITAMGDLNARDLRTLEMWDDQIEQMRASYDETGFGYQPYRTDPAWGISIASPEFVRREVERRGDLQLVSFKPRGLERQDVYVCRRPG